MWKPVEGQIHPKVLDFGIAKVREGEGMDLTQTGTIMGTPKYMSPEQWGGSKHATSQSDQWSLGVIAFRCLTGRLPFEADELQALMMRVSMHAAPPLRSFAPTTPAALEVAVLRALEKAPEMRHASVRAFARALLPFADASTRHRWTKEFGGEATPQHEATVDAQWTMAPTPAIPDTLNVLAKEIASPTAPATRRPSRMWAVGVVGAAAVAGIAFAALQSSVNEAPSRPPVPSARSAVAPAVIRAPTPPPIPLRRAVVAAVAQGPTPTVAPRPVVPLRTGGRSVHRERNDSGPAVTLPLTGSGGSSVPVVPTVPSQHTPII